MQRDADDPIQAPPGVGPEDRLDDDYSPSIERDTEALQDDQQGSPAFDDPTIDRAEVKLLPGTGDDDDPGDVDVAPGELHMPHLPADRADDRPPSP